MLANDILHTIGNTPHIRINRLFGNSHNVYVKSERSNPGGSIKDRIALSMIEGPLAGIAQLRGIQHEAVMQEYCLFHATLADFYRRAGLFERVPFRAGEWPLRRDLDHQTTGGSHGVPCARHVSGSNHRSRQCSARSGRARHGVMIAVRHEVLIVDRQQVNESVSRCTYPGVSTRPIPVRLC